MITIRHKGDFSSTKKMLESMKRSPASITKALERCGKMGVAALASATPIDGGLTAGSWYYEIESNSETSTITFFNSNVNKGVNIAVILQYGHGTRNGGWVEGRDYINPSIQPVFDSIAEEAWREVTKL